MKATQLPMFPLSAVTGPHRVAPRQACIEEPAEVRPSQVEELPFDEDGDDQ